ncbi:MAG: UDP-N-acetylmuramate--L-alanine ligase [Christensenellales bacterium]
MQHIDNFKNGHVHFIGIGGASMSGLADILLDTGYRVSGSDIADGPILEHLRAHGAHVHVGHAAAQVNGAALVVYTAAISRNNPELMAAKREGIPVMDRATLLGQLMAKSPVAIGVSGAHGKTTTTSLIATILELAGKDPTIHIGGYLDVIDGNTKSGRGDCFVAEACEYVDGFLKLRPNIAVILNIDADHLDYFRDIDHIQQSFTRYARLVPKEGCLIVNGDDERAMAVAASVDCGVSCFSLENTACEWYATGIAFDAAGCPSFTVFHHGAEFGRFKLAIPGRHHVYNALAAMAATHICHVTAEDVARGLATFHGAGRRFETMGFCGGARIVQDYAHHPHEVQALLDTAELQRPGRIIAIFQPHTYSRTLNLFDQFTSAFDKADLTIITDIYAAREKDPGTIHARHLVDAIRRCGKQCLYIPAFEDIVSHVKHICRKDDLVLVIGAGTINNLSPMLVE